YAALPELTVFAAAQAMIARTLYRTRRSPTLMNDVPSHVLVQQIDQLLIRLLRLPWHLERPRRARPHLLEDHREEPNPSVAAILPDGERGRLSAHPPPDGVPAEADYALDFLDRDPPIVKRCVGLGGRVGEIDLLVVVAADLLFWHEPSFWLAEGQMKKKIIWA